MRKLASNICRGKQAPGLLLLLVPALMAANSYGPTTKDQTQLSTGKSTSGWFNMPDCAPDGGVHLNYKLDGGFVCATAGGGAVTPSAPTIGYPLNILAKFQNPVSGSAASVIYDGGIGDVSTWLWQCCGSQNGASFGNWACWGDDLTAPTVVASTAGGTFDAGNQIGRARRTLHQTVGTTNTNSGERMNAVYLWRTGGFAWCGRYSNNLAIATQRVFMGLKFGTNAVIAATNNPSAETNTVYMGRDADAGHGRCGIWSNDESGTATELQLDAGFPCNTTGQGTYDVCFWQPGGASTIDYWVQRLDDTSYAARGTISSDLPMTYAQGTWQMLIGTAYASGSVNSFLMMECSIWKE